MVYIVYPLIVLFNETLQTVDLYYSRYGTMFPCFFKTAINYS